ncbi:MAG TPA: acyltransferase, partial [Cytophagaceae bacterium]|nr:acyltransferase [Cytophagaceae bacterium]
SLRKSNIYVEKGSNLILQSKVELINSNIHLTGNSELIIGSSCIISDSIISIHNSKCELENGTILKSWESRKSKLISENAAIKIARNVRLIGTSIYSRFSSLLEIGEYSGFSAGSEIFCHEYIKIGKFALVAEDVCIYDTNSHSVNSQKRAEEMKSSYPGGLWDSVKPTTKPIIIGDNVWLGKGSAILKGVILEDNCIVGMKTVLGGGKFNRNSTIVGLSPKVLIK